MDSPRLTVETQRNGPAYRPRDYCSDWRAFGHGEGVRFARLTGNVEHDGLVIASIQQHRFALRVRAAIAAQSTSIDKVAEAAGMSRSKSSDVLCGTRPLRLSDVGKIMVVLGMASSSNP